MATLTTFLSLTKPAFNEYFDSWDEVVNANMDLIDAEASRINTLTLGAEGGFGTIALRFADVEADVLALDNLNDLADVWTEGVPAAGAYLGPNDAVVGQSDVGKMFHSFGLQLAELTGVSPSLDVVAGLATMLGRVKQGILVAGGADLIAIGTPTTGLKVDPATDFELLVNGEYALIRSESPEQQLPATAPAIATRYYLVAESVGWSDLVGGAVDGETSGSTFTGTFTGGANDARPGDILDLTASGGANDNLGAYVIATMGAGTLTIRGTFPLNLTGHTFRFRRRHWPTLSLQKWGVEIDTILDGQAYLGAPTPANLVGTVLGHARMTAGGAVFNMGSDPAVQYSPGLSYDSGWVLAGTFWSGPIVNGGQVSHETTLPEIPANSRLMWSLLADAGAEAVDVPLAAPAFGLVQVWNQNLLEVECVDPAGLDAIRDKAGVAVTLATLNAGYFRLIAKG